MQAKGGVLIFLNESMSHKESQKDYGIGAQILNTLNIKKIKLLSSGGKHSFIGLNGFGLEIIEEIQIEG
jgi:3,4-dihydroxy 2-butanone 4-phosphate synthase/GTP cyclohydrolase II